MTTTVQISCTFEFQCPKQWDALKETSDKSVRFCDQCDHNVYFCTTDEQILKAGSEGKCIAYESSIVTDSDFTSIKLVGKPSTSTRQSFNEIFEISAFPSPKSNSKENKD